MLLGDGRFRTLAEVAPELSDLCLMQFYPGDSLHGDHTNYWSPNAACTRGLMQAAGFAVTREAVLGTRGIFVGRRVFESTQVYHRRIEKATIAGGRRSVRRRQLRGGASPRPAPASARYRRLRRAARGVAAAGPEAELRARRQHRAESDLAQPRPAPSHGLRRASALHAGETRAPLVVTLAPSPRAALGAIVVLGTLLSWRHTRHVHEWLVMTDELQYLKLGRSFGDGSFPLPTLRGDTHPLLSVLYPLLIAPVLALFWRPTAISSSICQRAAVREHCRPRLPARAPDLDHRWPGYLAAALADRRAVGGDVGRSS